MKTITHMWNFLAKNWDIVLTMVISAVIGILSIFQTIEPQVVSAAILSVLFLIACSLLVNRETNYRLQQTTEKVWSRMQGPSVGDVVFPYDGVRNNIKRALSEAKEVWILSRTCTRLWDRYQVQFKEILNRKGNVRLLLIDPHSDALRMMADRMESASFRGSDNPVHLLQSHVENFIKYIVGFSAQIEKGVLALRTINYLPAQTLVIINGGSEKGLIFVELSTFRSQAGNRPTFSLLKAKDKQLFTLYRDEFIAMWDCANPMEGLLIEKSNEV